MSRHRVTLILDVDDELLADHIGSERSQTVPPYTADVSEWDASDILYGAISEGIVDPSECEVDSYDGEVKVKDEEPEGA